MLIGIISDSHDNMSALKKAVDFFNDSNVDLVLHAGDLISPICYNEIKRLKMSFVFVFGNNDGEKKMWYERIKGHGQAYERYYETVLEQQKILMMHEPYNIDALAESGYFDILIYGHTHRKDHKTVNKTLIINPGESGGWLTGKSTIALLKLPEKELSFIDL